MDTMYQDFGGSEQWISCHIEVEKEVLDIMGEEMLEHVSCIKQEKDDESLEQCTQVEAAIKEEPAETYLETWQELEFVSVKEEIKPEPPVPIREIEANDIFGDGAVSKKSIDGSVDNNANEDGETRPSAHAARDLNGDSDRFLHEKNKDKIAKGTPKPVRKRRRRKPRYDGHLSEKPFRCKTCQKCFRKPEQLRSHKLFHLEERQFLCDTCGKGFVTSGDLKRHGVVHTGEKPYACPMCPKTFTQLCNMQSHLRKRCQIRGFGCGLCNKMFKDQEDLQKHKATHGTMPYHGNSGRRRQFCQDMPPFICDMCSLCFSNKRNLIAHIRTHMGLVVSLVCEICGKKCTRKERLIVHIRSHTGEKPFSCSVCGRAFSQQCNLKKHEVLHLPD